MLRHVCRAFNNDDICAAEAGTGVGKSLAYLVPAVAWAARNGERVVVSTNTINLQQQLMEKDIPLAKKVLGEDPKVVLVKGRGNYLCLHRLGEALEEMGLFDEKDAELLSIREWGRTTETGQPHRPVLLSHRRNVVKGMLRGRRLPRAAVRPARWMLRCEGAP